MAIYLAGCQKGREGELTCVNVGPADEIHPQLVQLRNDGEVIVAIPPVRTFRKIVERLNAAQAEERFALFVEGRQPQ